MIKQNLSTVAILFWVTTSVFSQNKISEALNTYFEQAKKGASTLSISEKLLTFNNIDVLSEVEGFTADTSVDKRFAAYRLIDYLGHNVTSQDICKRALKQLIFGLSDRDGGIVGVNLKSISSFNVNSFDAELKYMISELAKLKQPHYDMFIKLCGWLDTKDLIYNFRKMITEKSGDVRSRWAMRLAMARMGEADMVDYCLQRVKKIPVNDDVVYDLVPDILYTRQKLLFDYLLGIIESDEKNCSSPNPDSDVKLICAYRVMEQMAPYIDKFPIEVDASGDLKVKDYDKALIEVRGWIMDNRETYVIKRDDF